MDNDNKTRKVFSICPYNRDWSLTISLTSYLMNQRASSTIDVCGQFEFQSKGDNCVCPPGTYVDITSPTICAPIQCEKREPI